VLLGFGHYSTALASLLTRWVLMIHATVASESANAIFQNGGTYEIDLVENPWRPPGLHRRLGRADHHGQCDEAALIQLWREKRGGAEPEDLSGNLIVQLGAATEELNRTYERNTGRRVTCAPTMKLPALSLPRLVCSTPHCAFVGKIQDDPAGLGFVRERGGLCLQHDRIADAFGHCDRFVGRADEVAVGHPNAGGCEHFLAQPLGLGALAERGQASRADCHNFRT
jgi:hypothetical protein